MCRFHILSDFLIAFYEVNTMKKWWILYALVSLAVLSAAAGLRKSVTVFSETRPFARSSTVLIDPGHGGEDGGAISCTGKKESDINLAISLRLGDLIELLGHRVQFVRTDDRAVYTAGSTLAEKKASDLKQRVAMASEPGILLLSIHQNTFPEGRYRGAQVFFSKTPDSEALAKAIQQNLNQTLKGTRQSKSSQGVYLMEHIPCTGVLIECGFLSNMEEEALLCTAEYQKKLCAAIAATTAVFLSGQQ